MIRERTLFILGAGASHPYGYPVGLELRQQIIGPPFLNVYTRLAQQGIPDRRSVDPLILELGRFRSIFDESSRYSIDLFLSNSPVFEDIGKMAILTLIYDAEQHSRFRERVRQDLKEDLDWYSFLFNKMMENLEGPEAYDRFLNNEVAFITFNYDRSLEHFLFMSLKSLFHGVSEQEIVNQVANIRIHHVYGCFDKLRWQGGGKDYGNDYSFGDIDGLKQNIKLIGDRSNIENIEEMKTEIRKASRIFFLGFAYAPENLQVLGIPLILRDHAGTIRGTGVGFTQEEIQRIQSTFMNVLNTPAKGLVIIDDCDCKMLLRKYL